MAQPLALLSLLALAAACKSAPAGSARLAPTPVRHPEAHEVSAVEITHDPVTSGSEVIVHFRAQPRGGWHVNLAYPTRLELASATGLGTREATLSKTDARIMDAGGIRFEVPVRGVEPGEHALTGRFMFAMCADGRDCVVVEHPFDLKISVQ